MSKKATRALMSDRQAFDAWLRLQGCTVRGRPTVGRAIWWHPQHGLHDEVVMAQRLGLDKVPLSEGKS